MSSLPQRRRVISRVNHDRQQRTALRRSYTKKRAPAAASEGPAAALEPDLRIAARQRPRGTSQQMQAQFCRDSAANGNETATMGATRQNNNYSMRVQRLESGLQSALEETRKQRSVYAYNFVPEAEAVPKMDWRRDDIDLCDELFVPRTLTEVVDNRRSVDALDRWLALWTAKPLVLPRSCVAMLMGNPGVGKTTTVRLLLRKHGFRAIEINGSDQRSKSMVDRLRALIMQSSVDGVFGRTAIVIEEVDGLHVGGSGGGGGGGGGGGDTGSARQARNAATQSRVSGKRGSGRAGQRTATSDEDDYGTGMASAGAIAGSGGGSSGSDALVKFLKSSGIHPKRCDRRGLAAATAASIGGNDDKWLAFRSTVPIILLANESSAAFMKKLRELTLFLRFWPIDERQVRYRIVNQLSVALNVKWSRPKSDGLYKDLPLYDVLVAHSAGDLRKATALMADVVRAAYSRRRSLPQDHRERQTDFLLVRRSDCVAFFGESKEDVMDSVPTLFGAARFLLCQMRCRCGEEQACSCTKRRRTNDKFGDDGTAVAAADGAELSVFVAPHRATVFEQAQRMAAHDIRVLPHMLFENSHRCAAEPLQCHSIASRLAASRVRCELANWFALADAVRANTNFLRDRRLQDVYMQFGMVAPSLLVRYPERYADIGEKTVARPTAIERANGGARINLQKSSLDGENGNGAHTMSLAKDERNAYVRHFHLPYQVDLARWYDSDNYVSKVDETRAQKQMLCQESRKRRKRKDRTDDFVVVSRSKMTKAEINRLRTDMRREQQRQHTADNAIPVQNQATASTADAVHASGAAKQAPPKQDFAAANHRGGQKPQSDDNKSSDGDRHVLLRRQIKVKI